MKKEKFNVWFEDGSGLKELASSKYEAFINAVHKKMNLGENSNVDSIEDERGNHFAPHVNFELLVV